MVRARRADVSGDAGGGAGAGGGIPGSDDDDDVVGERGGGGGEEEVSSVRSEVVPVEARLQGVRLFCVGVSPEGKEQD